MKYIEFKFDFVLLKYIVDYNEVNFKWRVEIFGVRVNYVVVNFLCVNIKLEFLKCCDYFIYYDMVWIYLGVNFFIKLCIFMVYKWYNVSYLIKFSWVIEMLRLI